MRMPWSKEDNVKFVPEDGGRVDDHKPVYQETRAVVLEPSHREVADYAVRHKLHTSTEKLAIAYRAVRKQRLQMAIQYCQGDQLLKSVLSEVIDLL